MQLAGRTLSRRLLSRRLDQERTMITPPSQELSFVEATIWPSWPPFLLIRVLASVNISSHSPVPVMTSRSYRALPLAVSFSERSAGLGPAQWVIATLIPLPSLGWASSKSDTLKSWWGGTNWVSHAFASSMSTGHCWSSLLRVLTHGRPSALVPLAYHWN